MRRKTHPIQTKGQMQRKYPNHWLLIKDFQVNRATRLVKGKVIAHSKDRDEIHRALSRHKGNLCIHYTGKLPEDTGVLFYGASHDWALRGSCANPLRSNNSRRPSGRLSPRPEVSQLRTFLRLIDE